MDCEQQMMVSSIRTYLGMMMMTRPDTNYFMLVGYSNVLTMNLVREAQVLDGASCCVFGLIASTFQFARNK
jgi:hypothetical protein